jgi:hypothetical protein
MPTAHRFQTALQILLEAHQYAHDLKCDVWQFAVEIDTLSALGLTNNDLRWLLHQNYVDQAREVTEDGNHLRQFGPNGGRKIDAFSRFILTPAGVLLSQSASDCELTSCVDGPSLSVGPKCLLHLPTWDKDRRILRFGPELVKQFKTPAPNQEVVLAAFEEEGWPVRIDDPLPMHPAIDPKRRLHDTINSLNRNQLVRRLRFIGNGCGEAIRWEPAAGTDGEPTTEAKVAQRA